MSAAAKGTSPGKDVRGLPGGPAEAAAGELASPPSGESVSAPTRELAQRLSGADEILLLWQPESDRVELSVRDRATGTGLQIEVAPDSAIDAFYHPYAYAARHVNSYRVVRAEPTIVDG